jgi:hypothetical protein
VQILAYQPVFWGRYDAGVGKHVFFDICQSNAEKYCTGRQTTYEKIWPVDRGIHQWVRKIRVDSNVSHCRYKITGANKRAEH